MKKVMVCAALLLAFASQAFATAEIPDFSSADFVRKNEKYYAYTIGQMDGFFKYSGNADCRVYYNTSDIDVVQAVISAFEQEGFVFVYRWSMIDAKNICLRFNKGKDKRKQTIAEAQISTIDNGTRVIFKCLKWLPYGSVGGPAAPRHTEIEQIMTPICNVEKHLQDDLSDFVEDIRQYRDYVKLALPRGLGAMHYYGWVRSNRPTQ